MRRVPAQDRIVEYIEENPGASMRQVALALYGIYRQPAGHNAIRRAIRAGRIRAEHSQAGGYLLYPTGHSSA